MEVMMSVSIISYKKLFAVLTVLSLLLFAGICAAHAQDLPDDPIITPQEQIPADKAEAFKALLERIQKNGKIPDLDGEINYYGNFSNEYAKADSIHWDNFIKADRFVFSAKLNWSTEQLVSKSKGVGCGITFNVDDSDKDFIYLYWGADEIFHHEGVKAGRLFTDMKSGDPKQDGTIDFTVIVDGDTSFFFLQFEKYGSTWSGYFFGPQETDFAGNNVGMAISNGANQYFQTRCDWSDIFFYTW